MRDETQNEEATLREPCKTDDPGLDPGLALACAGAAICVLWIGFIVLLMVKVSY